MKAIVIILAVSMAFSAEPTFGFAGRDDVPDPAGRVPFADPFVLCANGTYYAYGTHRCMEGIGVATSRDLREWDFWVGKSKDGFALHKDDSYGDGRFFAPEVYRIGNRYHMYYSADSHVCVAVADSPLGPFRQAVKKPMLEERAIDSSLFIDRDGKAWMPYVKLQQGNHIMICELTDDLLGVKPGTSRSLIEAELPWERLSKGVPIAEGPFILRNGDVLLMTYSANDYHCPDYALGSAVAVTPAGPWAKDAEGPFLRRFGGLKGTGHHSFFRDAEGQLKIVFHAHNAEAPDGIHPRCMYVADAEIRGTGASSTVRATGEPITCRVRPGRSGMNSD